MKVMGHRGAAGLALENTLDSFELAKLLGVDSIEVDIHVTKDNQLVAVHDTDLSRISDSKIIIKNHTLQEIQDVVLSDGHSRVPTLESVIIATDTLPLVLEIKSNGCIEPLIGLMKKYKKRDFTIVSFKHTELAKLRKLDPKFKLYSLEHTKPFEIIQLARSLKLDGIGLNYWLLNPLTYWMCHRSKLDIYIYTVNSRLIGRAIHVLYPKVIICTDYPERFVKNLSSLKES